MENKITGNDYQVAKKRAKEFYKTIGRLWCPVLNDYVVFNNIGFRHLIRKGHTLRLLSDQIKRFVLLNSVKHVIANADAKMTCEEKEIAFSLNQKGEKIHIRSTAKFWKITTRQGGETVTVVVRQVAFGKKHFFSIYNQKTAR